MKHYNRAKRVLDEVAIRIDKLFDLDDLSDEDINFSYSYCIEK